MKIATWNINGVKARIDTALAWLKEAEPDIVCFQEIKSIDENFPRDAFGALGYNVATHGQKGFNGVAILSKLPFDEVTRGLPGNDGDEQARFIEAVVSVPSGSLRVVSLYLPNGNPVDTEKFPYKLAWMERLEQRAKGTSRGRRSLRTGRRLQRYCRSDRREAARGLGRRRAVPAGEPAGVSRPAEPRPDRGVSRLRGRPRALYVLGLSGRRLAEEQRHPHRSPAVVAASSRPLARLHHRRPCARLGQTVRSRADLDRSRYGAQSIAATFVLTEFTHRPPRIHAILSMMG